MIYSTEFLRGFEMILWIRIVKESVGRHNNDPVKFENKRKTKIKARTIYKTEFNEPQVCILLLFIRGREIVKFSVLLEAVR